MCGIFGIINKANGGLDRETFIRARDLLEHRGPDDSGFYGDDDVMLGHRRLSIIDISGGHQPMSSSNGSVWLIYNGEIYNYRELRNELIGKGHSFKSASDTEVILTLYQEEGVQGFERLNGIFAFAVWDKRNKEMHLVRDQMGVKPLYYAITSKGLVFSSEIKSILESGVITPELEADAMSEYLIFRDVAGERTMFRGIRRLLPGHRITIKGNQHEVYRYWNVVSDTCENFTGSFTEAVDELEELLSNSVKMQMVSDVPLGTFCSGGVDSSLVTAIASKYVSEPINTFSVGFEEEAFDESLYAKQVSEHCGTTHHELRLSNQEFASDLEQLIWHNDEPLHFPNSVHIYAVSRLARQYVTVVLTGEGADELFGGYPRYQIPSLLTGWNKVPAPARLMLGSVARVLGDHRVQKLENSRSLPKGWDVLLNSASSDAEQMRIESNSLHQAITPYRKALYDATAHHIDVLNRVSLLDQQTYLVSILNRQDKMSMATSIESRVPFLDPKIVRFANSLPPRYKQGRLDNKRVVKALALKYLPEEVIKRRKSGFGVPLADWFRSDSGLGALIGEYLKDDLTNEIFGTGTLTSMYEQHRTKEQDYSDTLWAALNLVLWKRAFRVTGDLKAAA